MKIFAVTETIEDVRLAAELGADGIGECSTDHMFFSTQTISTARAAFLSSSRDERISHLNMMISHQEEEMLRVFRYFDGKPVCIRLLDPPMYKFLPTNDADIRDLAACNFLTFNE